MPSLEQRDRPHKAVWWPKEGTDRYGQPKVGDPVEIKVRWTDKRSERRQADGSTVMIEGSVVADREMTAGDMLWRGGLDDLPGTGLLPESDVMQVYGSNATPDLKGRNIRYEATFMRWKATLPGA